VPHVAEQLPVESALRPARRSRPLLFRISRSLVAALILGLLWFTAGSAAHPPSAQAAGKPAAGQKVVIVVGPAASSTGEYIRQANELAGQAEAEGMRVVKIYTPRATWAAVKQKAQNANLLVYLGHGSGYPNRNGGPRHEDRQDGFGLNPCEVHCGTTGPAEYHGADQVRRNIQIAKNGITVLWRLCYASGNAESGIDAPELPSRAQDRQVAIERVDNFASGFLAAGSRVVIAWGWPQKINLPEQLARTNKSINRIFEDKANNTGSPNAFIGKWDYTVQSRRTPGALLHLDPHNVYGHLRAISGDLGMTAADWRGETHDDITAPELTDVAAAAGSVSDAASAPDAIPSFSPNGDAIEETLSIRRTLSESATLRTVVTDSLGAEVISWEETADSGPGTTEWDGLVPEGARAPDGLYAVTMTPRDHAGNAGTPREVPVRVLTPLSSPTASDEAIEVADADALGSSVRFSADLGVPAAVSWKVVDASGNVVKTGPQNEPRDPALDGAQQLFVWDGTDDLSQSVPDGTYRGLVSAVTDAGTVTYGRAVFVGPFRVAFSDSTPARGQQIKVAVLNTEPLGGPLQLEVTQRGLAPYTVAMTQLSDRKSTVTFSLEAAPKGGRATFRILGTDTGGGAEELTLYRWVH
jgi:flagellar hook assembly protein FlgD